MKLDDSFSRKTNKASLLAAGAQKSTKAATGLPEAPGQATEPVQPTETKPVTATETKKEEKKQDKAVQITPEPADRPQTPQEPLRAPERKLAADSPSKPQNAQEGANTSRRGRPSSQPREIGEDGLPTVGINVRLDGDLNMFLEFCMEQDKTIKSKVELIKLFIRKAREKNGAQFEVWKQRQLDKPTYSIDI